MNGVRYTLGEQLLFNQLFGSANFVNGGVGRSSVEVILRCTTVDRLVAAAAERGAHVLRLGTDFIVIKASASFERVYAHPKAASL